MLKLINHFLVGCVIHWDWTHTFLLLQDLAKSKIRPLRVCLDNEAIKRRILSRSSQLRSKAEWENVYANPDMTLAERNANKKPKSKKYKKSQSQQRGITQTCSWYQRRMGVRDLLSTSNL